MENLYSYYVTFQCEYNTLSFTIFNLMAAIGTHFADLDLRFSLDNINIYTIWLLHF